MKTVLLSLCLWAVLFVSANTFAGELTGRDIIKRQKDNHKSSLEIEKQMMMLIDKSGKKEIRQVKRYSKEMEDDVYRYLLVFLDPKDIKGVSLLTWQNKNGGDDQWLYMPAMGKQMKRIAGGSKKSYFMGTDFTYEDLSPDKIDNYTHKLLKEEKVGADDCYVVESVPANETVLKDSGYSKKISWIRKDIFFTVKVEFYDKRGKLLKTQTVSDVEKIEGNLYRAKKVLMDHHKKNHKTAILINDRKIGSDIPDDIFTERSVLKEEALLKSEF